MKYAFYIISFFLLLVVGNNFGMTDAHAPAEPSATPVAAPAGAAPGVTATPLAWQSLKDAEVTTINEERGNWVVKAKIFKEAQKLSKVIQKKVLTIEPLQEKFLTERADLDKNILNPFYTDFGLQGGELDARLNGIVDDLKKLEMNKAVVDDKERLLRDETKRKKEALEELKKSFAYLQKLEEALSQSLITMSAQIQKALVYQEEAWNDQEKIGDILNDEIAQDLYSKMQVILDNVTAIENYLNGELKTFFTTTIQKITEQVDVVKKKVIGLKGEGIALGKKMKELQDAEEAARLSEEKKAGAQQEKAKEKAARTWLSPVFDAISWFWETVKSAFKSLYNTVAGWFTKSEKKKPATVESAVESAVMPAQVAPVQAQMQMPVLPQPAAVSVPEPVHEEVKAPEPAVHEVKVPEPIAPETVAAKSPTASMEELSE